MYEIEEKTDLLEYLPEYLREYRELREIMATENAEFGSLTKLHRQNVDDRFLTTCGPSGMARFEAMMGITPRADDSLETRRFRALSRWNRETPYNYAYLEEQLRLLCGKHGYDLRLDVSGPALVLKIGLTSKNMLDAVKELEATILPCHILTDIDLLYNQHKTLGTFLHRRMADYTHKQLREDVIS